MLIGKWMFLFSVWFYDVSVVFLGINVFLFFKCNWVLFSERLIKFLI